MERAVIKGDLEINYRESGQESLLGSLLYTLVDSWYVLAGDDTADDLVFKDIPFAARHGRHLYPAVAILSASTRLLLVLTLDLDAAANRLQIRDFGGLEQNLDIEFPLQFLDDNVKMHLPHTRYDELFCLLVPVRFESRLLLDHLVKGTVDLVLIVLGLGLDGIGDHRLEQGSRFENDRSGRITEGISGNRLLQLCHCNYVSGHSLLDRFLLLTFELVNLADPLLDPFGRIHDRRVGIQDSGVNTEDRDLAGIRIGSRLEHQGGERLGFKRSTLFNGLRFRVDADCLGPVQRRGEIGADCVKQLLYPDICSCRAAEHRGEGIPDSPDPQTVKDLLLGQVSGFKIFLCQRVISLRNRLDHLLPQPFCLIKIFSRNLDLGKAARGVRLVAVGLHLDKVDDPFEILLQPERDLDCHPSRLERFLHIIDGTKKIRPLPVQLVYECDARNLEFVCPCPDFFGLDLDP